MMMKANQATENLFSLCCIYAFFFFFPWNTALCYCAVSILQLSADCLWERVCSPGLVTLGMCLETLILHLTLSWMPFCPYLLEQGVSLSNLTKNIKVQADTIPCAIFKSESMQIHMQVRHGSGILVCLPGYSCKF